MEDYVKNWIELNSGKKIVVFYGNCHTTAIIHKLNQVENFKNKYAIFPFDAIQNVKDPDYFDNGILGVCDLFIHQVIRNNNRYGIQWSSNEIIKKLKKDCLIIGIPNVYHLPICFFQQFVELKDFHSRNGNTVFFRDSILDTAYINKWSLKSTLDYYQNGNLGDDKKVRNDFYIFIEKVRCRERDWDVKISDFLVDNYKSVKLFYDPNHPTPVVINEITNRLLNMLGIKDEHLIELSDFYLDSYEMPICGYAKHSLELEYDDKIIRKTGIKKTRDDMDLEEYIHEYWAYEWQNENVPFTGKTKSFYHFVLKTMIG